MELDENLEERSDSEAVLRWVRDAEIRYIATFKLSYICQVISYKYAETRNNIIVYKYPSVCTYCLRLILALFLFCSVEFTAINLTPFWPFVIEWGGYKLL